MCNEIMTVIRRRITMIIMTIKIITKKNNEKKGNIKRRKSETNE